MTNTAGSPQRMTLERPSPHFGFDIPKKKAKGATKSHQKSAQPTNITTDDIPPFVIQPPPWPTTGNNES